MATVTNTFSAVKTISKTPTGIHALDEILLGGLPEGRTTLVNGGPGTGKTMLGLEFLYRGALAGEPGIFVTFEESADAVRRSSQAMGWDIEALEEKGLFFIVSAGAPTHIVLSGDFEIDGLLAILEGQVQAIGAKRIVIDAMDGLLRIFEDPLRQQNQVHLLHHWLTQQELTAVLTAKQSDNVMKLYHNLDYLVDCVVNLDQRVVGQVATRRLRVTKYRASGFLSNEYPYVITNHGIELIPVSTSQLRQQQLGERVPTGNKELDELLGGGFRRTASILIAGSSGSGKTTLASTFTAAACARGERVLYVSFEESQEALVNTMLSPGVDLRPALAAQQLQILTALPESLGVEEHLLRILHAIEAFRPDHFVLEAISASQRMGTKQAAFDFVMRLIDSCKSQGITSIYTNQTRPGFSEKISGIGISSLLDTLILLEQKWSAAEYERRLLIIKSRGSKHSHQFHTFTIDEQGMNVNGPGTIDAPHLFEEASL